jgi:DNA-binding NarL/FixJ family response regulator
MLTSFSDNERIFDSLRNGASGYILKSEGFNNILNRVKEVHAGGSPMSMSIARKVTNSFQNESVDLTDRQQEILSHIAKGKSYQTIANELHISKATVKDHIKKIYAALHVSNNVQAAVKAVKHGLIP